MSSDEIFVTQSTMRDSDSVDTDGILSYVLDVENNADKAKGMNVQVKRHLFSDISSSDDEVLAQTTQGVERNLQKERFSAPLSETDLNKMVTNSKSENTAKKAKWAVNLFNSCRSSRNGMNTTGGEIGELCLSLGCRVEEAICYQSVE
jgi:hypothetical protein